MDNDAMVERVARALSIPQHHTGWRHLPETEKDLFYMQADYALKELHYAGLVEELAEVTEVAKGCARREHQAFSDRKELLLALKRSRLALNLVPANDKRFNPANHAKIKVATDIIDKALAKIGGDQ